MARSRTHRRDFGDTSPAVDLPPDYDRVGDRRWNVDLTTQALGLLGWHCTVAGRPGTWVADYTGFGGAPGPAIPRVATIALLVAIDVTGYASTQSHLAEVLSVGDYWKHDPTTSIAAWSNAVAYVVGDLVRDGGGNPTFISIQAGTNHATTDRAFWMPAMERVSTSTGVGSWMRLLVQNEFNKKQHQWYVDPQGTAATPGNDEADGLTASTPLRNMAEYHRRANGADYSTNCYIKLLSDLTRSDEMNFNDIGTLFGAFISIYADPIVVFSRTLTNRVIMTAPVTRGQIVDTGLPAASWTAADGITTTSGSRWIRNTAKTIHAPILKDLGSFTAQIGNPTNTSELPTAAVTNAIANFGATDAYDVVRYVKCPSPRATGLIDVRTTCLDIAGSPGISKGFQWNMILCGSLSSCSSQNRLSTFTNCVFVGGFLGGTNPQLGKCSLLNTLFQASSGPEEINWNGETNIFINSAVQFWHGINVSEGGVLAFFDNTGVCVSARHGAIVERFGVMGVGNTSSLLLCELGSQMYIGGSFDGGIVATTSDTTPIVLAGTAYSLAALTEGSLIDRESGCGIYRS